jgi:nucleotide-binding universal stress UspA family protein
MSHASEPDARSIRVAFDGSDRGRGALLWAAAESRSTGSPLEIVTVVEPGPLTRWVPGDALSPLHEAHARRVLATATEELAAGGFGGGAGARIGVGRPAEVLADLTRDGTPLVVGRRGRGGFARLLIGSTAVEVAARAVAPVTVVPDGWDPERHGARPVVVGIDPAVEDQSAVERAARFALGHEVPLVAVHGWEEPVAATTETPETWSAVKSGACAAFDRVVADLGRRREKLTVEGTHVDSHPALAVLAAAEEAQLVVLGRRPVEEPNGFAFGSVSHAVLHYAQCPVQVVPAGQAGVS